ncbi:MAG: hypothetical protein LBH11_01960 [Propionibacteriaceae bacterium]|nr:hypothetical protein [Propionibacteriaceae bacterium]
MTDVAANSESVAFASAPALTVGVRELAKMAQVSPGTVSKILPVLVADGAVVRDSHGYITAVNRRQLLDRWTIDYHVLESNGTPAYFVAPRGIAAILTKLKAAADEALTGAQAGSLWLPEGIVPLVPVTQLVIYTTSTDKSASHLGLVPVDAPAANVILIQPQDPAIIDDPMRKKDIPVAPLPLVLADLLTLPGRYPQQAEALMDALAKTDPAWKS